MVTAQEAPAYAIVPGNCLEILSSFGDETVDSIVTDPPYGLSNTDPAHVIDALTHWLAGDRAYVPDVGGGGFMGKAWDKFVPPPAVWDECLRVLKPGGHLLSFAGTRTIGLMEMSIRLAGFEIRDSIAWLYGSGFPKSLDVSKAIDKANGNPLAFREFARAYSAAVSASPLSHSDVDRHLGIKSSSCYWAREDHRGGMPPRHHWEPTRALLRLDESLSRLYDEAERAVIAKGYRVDRHEGHVNYGSGTPEGVYDITAPATPEAEQWQGFGTALKPAFEPVVVGRKPFKGNVAANVLTHGTGALNIDGCRIGTEERTNNAGGSSSLNRVSRVEQGYRPGVGEWETSQASTVVGRWPANVVLDASQAAALDAQSGNRPGMASQRHLSPAKPGMFGVGDGSNTKELHEGYNDSGGASRFFYCAKAPKKERPAVVDADGKEHAHPTVKPLALMRWLVRLVTPPGGVVLDPFAGSGPTLEAALLEGFTAVAIELGGPEDTPEHHYPTMIQQRADRALAEIAARPTPETAQEEESIPA